MTASPYLITYLCMPIYRRRKVMRFIGTERLPNRGSYCCKPPNCMKHRDSTSAMWRVHGYYGIYVLSTDVYFCLLCSASNLAISPSVRSKSDAWPR